MEFKDYLAQRCQKIAEKLANGRTLTNTEEVAWFAMSQSTLRAATNVYALLDFFEENNFDDAALVGSRRLWRAYEKARARAATPRITYNHTAQISAELRADLKAMGYTVMHRGNGQYWTIMRDLTMDKNMLAKLAAHANKKNAAD